jgi:hypothetical protein
MRTQIYNREIGERSETLRLLASPPQSSTSTASLSTSANGGSATSNWIIVLSIGLLASLGPIVENDFLADACARTFVVERPMVRWLARNLVALGKISSAAKQPDTKCMRTTGGAFWSFETEIPLPP